MPAPSRPLLASALALLLGVGGSAWGLSEPVAATDPSFRVAAGPAVGNVLTAQVASVDGDDVPDLVTGLVGEGFLVELGRGDGSFRAPRKQLVPNGAYGVAVGDVDRDGRDDVVALSNGSPATVRTFLGSGDETGTLRPGPTSSVVPSGYAPLLARLDGDAHLDLAVTVSGTTTLYSGNGTGAFTPAGSVSSPGAAAVYAPLAADLNGDGRTDVVLPTSNGRVGVLLATGTPFGFTHVLTTATSAFDVAVGDLDGQAGHEVAYAAGARAGYLSFAAGRVVDTALTSATATVTTATGVSVADYDDNGLADVGLVSGATSQRLFLAEPPAPGGVPAFRPARTAVEVDRASYAQTAADMDRDGRPDTVLTSAATRRSTVLVNTTGPAERRAPALTRQPADTTVIDGGTLRLTAASTGTPDTEVRWERRLAGDDTWTELAEGETTESRTGTSVTSTWSGRSEAVLHGARYRAVFSGTATGARRSTTDAALVTVAPPSPPGFTAGPQSTRVREGSDVAFSVSGVSGAPSPTVTWAVAGPGSTDFATLPSTGPVLTLPQVSDDLDGSTYRVTLTNAQGTRTATAVLHVDPMPVLVTPPASTSVRPGEPARFEVLAEDADIRWQASTDLGKTWGTLASTSAVLETSPVTSSQNGTRFRAQLRSRGTTTLVVLHSPAVVLTVDPAPAPPSGLSAVESAPGRLTVRWGGSTSTDVTGWAVVVDGEAGEHPVTTREAVVDGLLPGAHQVEVAAVDALGRGTPARTRVFTVGTPTAPTSPGTSAPTSGPGSTPASPAPSSTARPTGTPSPGSPAASPSASPSGTASPTTSPTTSPSAGPSASPSRTPAPTASSGPSTPTDTDDGSLPEPPDQDLPGRPGLPQDSEALEPDLQVSELSVVVADDVINAGGVSQLAGTAVPGSIVELVAYVRPSTRYTVLRSAVADDEGHFTFTVRPSGNMRAFVRTAEDVVSPSVVQQVRSTVGLTVTRRSARGFRFSGTVVPRTPGQLVTVYALSGGTRRIVTSTRTDARGTYRRDHVFATGGRTSTLVAVVGRSTAAEPGTSARRFATPR